VGARPSRSSRAGWTAFIRRRTTTCCCGSPPPARSSRSSRAARRPPSGASCRATAVGNTLRRPRWPERSGYGSVLIDKTGFM
jgi:hypothetical protein